MTPKKPNSALRKIARVRLSQRQGSHRLHPAAKGTTCRSTDRPRPRRPRPRPAGRALPHRPRRARHASASPTASRPARSTAPKKAAAPVKGARRSKPTSHRSADSNRGLPISSRPALQRLRTHAHGLQVHRQRGACSSPDPRFSSKLASKFINCLMYDGKKTVAQTVFYDAMDLIEKRLPNDEPARGLQPRRRERQAVRRSPLQARRRCQLPGADAGQQDPPADPGDPLDPDRRPREEGPPDGTSSSPTSSSPPTTAKAPRSAAARTSTAWPTPTRRSPTSPGKRSRPAIATTDEVSHRGNDR